MTTIDELLAQADPMRSAQIRPLEPEVVHTLTEMTVDEPRPAGRPRRRRRAAVVALVIATIGIPTAAVAGTAGFHTGIFAGRDETEQVPGGELLDLSHPSIVDLVRQEASPLPLPPGDTFDPVLARYPLAEPTLGQRGVVVVHVQTYAQCRWYQHWLDGDQTTRSRAAAVIAEFPSWDRLSHFAPGDSGPQLLRDTVSQVQRGEETLVRQQLAANC